MCINGQHAGWVIKRTTAFLLTCFLAAPAIADAPENALLVQSVQAWERAAQVEDPADRVAALLAAQAAISSIIEDHPSSDLADRIVLGDSSLPFTRISLEDAIASAQAELEATNQTREVDPVLASVVGLLEEASNAAPTDRDSALRAYLMLREADTLVAHATEAYPLAGNLGFPTSTVKRVSA